MIIRPSWMHMSDMAQDKFQGRVFQWIKGEFEGQFERVAETRDDMIIFESDMENSPRRIRINALREFMIEHGAYGGDIPIDTETGTAMPVAAIANLTPVEPVMIGEEAVIFSLLEKQKKFEHIVLDLQLKLPILTAEAYEFLLSTFEREIIGSVIIKKAEKDIDEQLKLLANKAKADLISAIELKYTKQHAIDGKEREERIREVSQED